MCYSCQLHKLFTSTKVLADVCYYISSILMRFLSWKEVPVSIREQELYSLFHITCASINRKDADVNKAGCFLSRFSRRGPRTGLPRYIRPKLILINQLHSINDVVGALCAPKISTSQNVIILPDPRSGDVIHPQLQE